MNTNTNLNTWYASIIEKGQAKAICPNQLQPSQRKTINSNTGRKQTLASTRVDSFDSIVGSVFK